MRGEEATTPRFAGPRAAEGRETHGAATDVLRGEGHHGQVAKATSAGAEAGADANETATEWRRRGVLISGAEEEECRKATPCCCGFIFSAEGTANGKDEKTAATTERWGCRDDKKQ